MGQLDAALRTLELAPLNSKSRGRWVVRLRYAYADTLEAAGREQDALAWFHRTSAIDADAADRRRRACRGAGEEARLTFPSLRSTGEGLDRAWSGRVYFLHP